MLQKNILKEAPRLNKIIARAYQTLAGEFCLVNGEFSDLRCLMNILVNWKDITTRTFSKKNRALNKNNDIF